MSEETVNPMPPEPEFSPGAMQDPPPPLPESAPEPAWAFGVALEPSEPDPGPGPDDGAGQLHSAPEAPALDDRRRRLDPRYISQSRVTNWIVTAILALGSGIGFLVFWIRSDSEPWLLWTLAGGILVLLGAIACLSHVWPPLEFRRTSWRVDAERIEIKRGVVWRHVIVVPRTRIQHTDVSQGPVQRRFGLATLVVHTAGTHQYLVNLEGLSRETAFAARDLLIAAGREDGA